MNTTLLNIIAFALLGGAGSAQAVSVIVPGTSDPWLAGMPNGTTASSGDVAPTDSFFVDIRRRALVLAQVHAPSCTRSPELRVNYAVETR